MLQTKETHNRLGWFAEQPQRELIKIPESEAHQEGDGSKRPRPLDAFKGTLRHPQLKTPNRGRRARVWGWGAYECPAGRSVEVSRAGKRVGHFLPT